MWRVAEPATVRFEDLARACGLHTDRLSVTVDRLAKYGFAERPQRSELLVFTRCAPLTARELQQLPDLVVEAHARLVTAHLSRHLSKGDEVARDTDVEGFAECLAGRQHPMRCDAPATRIHNPRKENQPSCPG